MTEHEMKYKLCKDGKCFHGILMQKKTSVFGNDWEDTGKTCDQCEAEFAKARAESAEARVVSFKAEAELEEKEMELPVNSIKDTNSLATEYFNKLEITAQEAKNEIENLKDMFNKNEKETSDKISKSIATEYFNKFEITAQEANNKLEELNKKFTLEIENFKDMFTKSKQDTNDKIYEMQVRMNSPRPTFLDPIVEVSHGLLNAKTAVVVIPEGVVLAGATEVQFFLYRNQSCGDQGGPAYSLELQSFENTDEGSVMIDRHRSEGRAWATGGNGCGDCQSEVFWLRSTPVQDGKRTVTLILKGLVNGTNAIYRLKVLAYK